jgi:GAF domain-containing protein
MKVYTQSPLVKWGNFFSLTALYILAVLLFEKQLGEEIHIMVFLPIVAAGWMFGRVWGLVAGTGAIFLSTFLNASIQGVPWSTAIFQGNFLVYFFMIFTGGISGNLHNGVQKRIQTETTLRSRERYLSLLNDITHAIIASQDFDSLMQNLVSELASLLEADDCTITRWDAEKNEVTVVASTAKPTQGFRFPKDQPTLTLSALEAGGVILAEDLETSPYISAEVSRQFSARSAMGVPLIVGKYKIGALTISYKQAHIFTVEEQKNASQAGDQIALALWNAQQDFELQKRLRETDAMTRIARALSETERIGLANVLELIVNSAKELIPGAEQAVIHTLDSEKDLLMPEAVIGFQDIWAGKAKMQLGKGIAGESITSGETINVTDVQTDARFILFDTPVQFRSLMVTPIISGEKTLGTISVQSKQPNAFSKDEANLLRTLGINASIAIENARLLESTQQALRETNALYHISRGLLALDAEELLHDAVDLLQKNFGFNLVQVYLLDPETGDFILKASSSDIGKKLKEADHRLKAGAGIIGHVAETREPFFTNDVNHVIFHIKNPIQLDTKSEMAVPILAGDQLLGVLDVQQAQTTNFTPRDLQLVGIVADQLAASLQKAELYETLQISLKQEKAVRNQLIQNERLAVMGRLLASVSHELNNPLQAIQNALFLLKEEKGMSAQGYNDLEIVIAESERMASLIERLRDTYRPPQAEDLQPTHLNSIIADVYALTATHLRKNNVTFEFQPDEELPVIMALSDQIRQVALNLLMNGVEAMQNGGKLTVRTQYLNETNEIMMSVCDTGMGISPAILPYIFDPFVTNKKRGTGIGLTISHDIVLKHRGRLIAENNVITSGATFKVWLPVAGIPAEIE